MKHKIRQGFTLVEMVLYVALCSVILLSLSTFLSFLLQSRVKSQTIAEVNQQGFQIMQQMTQAVRNGRSIALPMSSATSSVLSVVTTSPVLNPTVYTASGTYLTVQEGGANPVRLTNSRVVVSSFLFQNIASSTSSEKTITISFTLAYTSSSTKQEYTYSKDFYGTATLRK